MVHMLPSAACAVTPNTPLFAPGKRDTVGTYIRDTFYHHCSWHGLASCVDFSQDLEKTAPHMVPLVQGYRGGYTKGERRKIEGSLFANKVCPYGTAGRCSPPGECKTKTKALILRLGSSVVLMGVRSCGWELSCRGNVRRRRRLGAQECDMPPPPPPARRKQA